MIIVDYSTKKVLQGKLWQYDYGQALRFQGGNLHKAQEIHFSLEETEGDSITRIGVTKDGVTDVVIPDMMLENNDSEVDYPVYVFIYNRDTESGETVEKFVLNVLSRSKPEHTGGSDDGDAFGKVIEAVNNAAERAETAEKQAEGWAHGREDMPDREEDNAMYYAEKAAQTAMEIPGQVEDAKTEIDRYVEGKEEELKGETGDVYFAAFKVVDGRLVMYSDPEIDKVRFVRIGSRLYYILNF